MLLYCHLDTTILLWALNLTFVCVVLRLLYPFSHSFGTRDNGRSKVCRLVSRPPLPPASSVSRAPCSHVASGYSGRLAGLSSLTSSKSYEIVHAVYGASSSEGGFSSLWHPLVVLATFMLFRRCLVLASVKLLLPLELPIIAASLWSSLGTFIISDL